MKVSHSKVIAEITGDLGAGLWISAIKKLRDYRYKEAVAQIGVGLFGLKEAKDHIDSIRGWNHQSQIVLLQSILNEADGRLSTTRTLKFGFAQTDYDGIAIVPVDATVIDFQAFNGGNEGRVRFYQEWDG